MQPRIRYAVISVLIASAPIAFTVMAGRPADAPGAADPMWRTLVLGAAQWYPWTLVAPIIDRRVRRQSVSAWALARSCVDHGLLLLLFSALHCTVVYAVTDALDASEPRTVAGLVFGSLARDLVLYSVLAAGFTIAESRRRQTEIAERLRAELAEARLDALRQQLNPHFLFNTLNHIVTELRCAEVAPAVRMLLARGDLLRDVLRERGQQIPLRDELGMVERYLAIERERFADRLSVQVTFEPRTLDALVPSLLLQPLVENVVRHGVSSTDGRCRVALTARADRDRLRINIQDDGPGLAAAPATTSGIGLTNTAERLRVLYGSDHTFEIRPAEDGGTLVCIDLPFRRS
jgi:anti-sigma regulatory factor (Ser/Thr protein kinase)